jgi:hypothetical protein
MLQLIKDLQFRDWLLAISFIVNVWLIVKNHRKTIKDRQYEYIENQFTTILKLQIDYPDFRKKDYWDTLTDKESEEARRYSAYCCLVWNTMETLWEKYGKKELAKSTFLPGMRSLAKRHQKWLIETGSLGSYKVEMISFLIEDKSFG